MTLKNTKEQIKQKSLSNEFSKQSLASVIVRPRITEKASLKAEESVYVFDISARANKRTVSAAIQKIYSVTPLKINVVRVPSKSIIVRGKKGVKSGGRKAYVYLKKGDKIEII
ncbi:MAG: 50S ribosomal protein L23 [Candidatus Pacebacteria bacterium]|nr:50S ribosomal protein L23 [Candidatus Paceibacterota bacterium]